MSTFTFTDASDSHDSTMNNYLVNHEINLIKIAIRNSIKSGIFYATVNNTVMTSVNYNAIPIITAQDTTGSGAEFSCNIGSIENITIINQQNTLNGIIVPKIIGDGIGATCHVDMTFSIDKITLTNFPYVPNKNAVITITGDGNSVDVTCNYNTYNYLTGITVNNTGQGYKPDTTKIICTIDGKVFDLTYFIDYTNGIVEDIIIDNNGSNYTYADVVFYNGNNIYNGIVANVTIDDGLSDISIVNPGNNYTENTKIIISGGNGNNAEILPIITNGQITGLNVINYGNGYSLPNTQNNGQTYFNAWKGVLCDNNLRDTLNEQMQSVIAYFQGQGYNITRMPTCNNLFYWLLNW